MGSLLQNMETLQLSPSSKVRILLGLFRTGNCSLGESYHQAKKTAERNTDQGGILLQQRSQEHKAIGNKFCSASSSETGPQRK